MRAFFLVALIICENLSKSVCHQFGYKRGIIKTVSFDSVFVILKEFKAYFVHRMYIRLLAVNKQNI